MARLYLDSLQTKVSKSELRDALRGLPAELSDVYHEAWSRITNQGESARLLAMKALRWLVFSFRQLTVKELSHAIAVRSGDVFLDKDRLVSEEILLGVCQGLVAIDEASSIIRLTHYTTQEYFENHEARYFSNVHDDLAATCLTYLNFRAFAGGPCKFLGSSAWDLLDQKGPIKKSSLLSVRCGIYPLLNYASSHWGNHVRHSSEGANEQALLELLQAPQALAASLQARTKEHTVSKNLPQVLGVLVLFGLTELLEKCLDGRSPIHIEAQNREIEIMLFEASRLGWSEMAHILVYVLVDAKVPMTPEEAIPSDNEAILGHALEANPEVTEKALEYGISHNISRIIMRYIGMDDEASKVSQRATHVLLQSIKHKKPKMAKIVIQQGADVNYRDEYGQTVLEGAVRLGYTVEAFLLIRGGADINAMNLQGQTVVFIAASEGYAYLLVMMLSLGVLTSMRDSQGWDLLDRAVASRGLICRRRDWIKDLGEDRMSLPLKESADLKEEFLDALNNDAELLHTIATLIGQESDTTDMPFHQDLMNALYEEEEQLRIIKTILKQGADIRNTTLRGETLLHLAIVDVGRLMFVWEATAGALNINALDS